MKLQNIIENILIEASKQEILVTKLGFQPDDAEKLEKMSGSLSVWLGKKIIQKLYSQVKSRSNNIATPEQIKDEIASTLKSGSIIGYFRNGISSIVDWYRVGLNGNIKPYENLSYDELFIESEKWHKSLDIGEGELNYVEKNKIIRDYRENGIGFYWCDLETNNSPEECDRMGHCGRTNSENTIYSLRENKKINEKFTMNKSHLTAAVGTSDGIVYQLKGPKNSKPNEKFHSYIKDLIINHTQIQGFGSEYNSKDDFSIADLPDEDVRKIYTARPELFNTRKLKRLLMDLGVIEKKEFENRVYKMDIRPEDIRYYVDGDWVVRRWTDKSGNKRETRLFETLLSGDVWDLFDNGGYDGDWQAALDYYVDNENEQKIKDIVMKIAQNKNFDYEDMSLEELIKEVDDNYDVRNALSSSMHDAEIDSYYNYYIKTLRDALSEYGEVLRLNDEGALIKIDILNIIQSSQISQDEVDEILEDRCDEDVQCLFGELVGDYFSKPDFRLDDRWSPDVDEEQFNENLADRLSEIGF